MLTKDFRPPDIQVIAKFTATSTDMLSGTDLDTPPSDGEMWVYAASSVNTATIEGPTPDHQPGKTSALPLWANGVPQLKDMVPWVCHIKQGKKPLFSLGGTVGTVFAMFLFWKA